MAKMNLEEMMLYETGWEVPDCPECGQQMLLVSFDLGECFDEFASEVSARFICAYHPIQHGHVFVIETGLDYCIRCKQYVSSMVCMADQPNKHPDIEFVRDHGQDIIGIEYNYYS